MRHMSVAISTWLGVGFAENGKIHWHELYIAILAGAFFPTLIAFLSKGIPMKNSDVEDTDEQTIPTKDTETKQSGN